MNYNDAYKNLQLKFTSGNKIEAERATITKEEWDAISPILKEHIDNENRKIEAGI